ncbi:MAG TPA: DUF2007 domain-containing protein [Myxococcota bacterium]
MSSLPPATSASPWSSSSLEPPADTLGPGEVVVGRYPSTLTAELARSRLDAAGIGAWLRDAHTAGLGPHLTQAIGGVKVVVAATDVDEALAVLELDGAVDDDTAADDDRLATVRNKADEAARYALLLAAGTAIFPVVGHLASVVLLWRARDIGVALSDEGAREARVAVAVDVLTAVFWLTVVLS